MKRIGIVISLALLAFALSGFAGAEGDPPSGGAEAGQSQGMQATHLTALSPEHQAVWSAVNARWQAWLEDDFDAYLAIHDDSWHRWALHSPALENLEDIKSFWERAKKNEQTLAFELTPISIELYGEGRFAAVHYVARETVRRLRQRTAPDGRVIPVGNETLISIRFSDFMVRGGDDWLYVGGYRDGSCALFKGFGRVCVE